MIFQQNQPDDPAGGLKKPELVTPRLELWPVQSAHRTELHRLFTDPDVRRYLLDDTIVGIDWVDETIAASQRQFDEFGHGLWAVYQKGQPTLIGVCGYVVMGQLELLYALLPGHWRRGFATEAARAVVDYGFREAGLTEIIAATDTPNAASFGVMERLGMRSWKTKDGLAYYRLPNPASNC